ncbi:MAG: NB-ARC domain-containing protein, partial [Thermoflexales bacterium]
MTTPDPRHPFGELLTQYRRRKPGLTQTRLAELSGYDQAILVRMCQGKKDLTGPSGRERVVRLIETLADQGALTLLEEASALLLAADMTPLFERQPNEARLMARLSRTQAGQPRRTNLPASLASFVGRADEIAEVRRLLGATRLLTLTGSGGCGKTRLAQRVAADALIAYTDGVWYVELAALTDPEVIPDEVGRALGLVASDQISLERVVEYLRERRLLLALDNCEHLIDAVASFAVTLLRACPRITILTTSREALGVEGETPWRVPSMRPAEAGRLFEARAAAARGGAELGAQTDLVEHICRRLDGMPLAIELAAARLQTLSLADVSARLDDRFNLLSGGRRGVMPRQQTLRATLDWSYDTLSDAEKVVFARLGVFMGGCAIAQAEQVIADEALRPTEVLSAMAQLAQKSLVMTDVNAGETRYRLLETVREYALEKLNAAG